MLLLAPREVTLRRRGAGTDAHGYPTGLLADVWVGNGCIDVLVGGSDPTRSDATTWSPVTRPQATVHLPLTAGARPGDVVVVDGKAWVVKGVVEVGSPVASGVLDELVCGCEAGDWWPE